MPILGRYLNPHLLILKEIFGTLNTYPNEVTSVIVYLSQGYLGPYVDILKILITSSLYTQVTVLWSLYCYPWRPLESLCEWSRRGTCSPLLLCKSSRKVLHIINPLDNKMESSVCVKMVHEDWSSAVMPHWGLKYLYNIAEWDTRRTHWLWEW